MTTSENGLKLIKDSEQLRLKAYRNKGDVPTIGWGHTAGVKMGDVITEAIAEHLLEQDVADAEADIARLVKVPLNQNQYDALCDFFFNLGGGWTVQTSTFMRLLNAGNYEAAAKRMLLWNKGKDGAGNLVELPGLTKRRAAESALFLTAMEPQ
jgi:lysozyme